MIRGIRATSFNEVSGYCSFVIFLERCNFRCGYCHNYRLLEPEKYNLPEISEDSLLKRLEFYKDIVDFVVFTGGEPTLHGKSLAKLLERIKDQGFRTGLETNGSNPDMIQYLIDNGLVDFVSMDIKGRFEDYDKITRTNVNIHRLRESVEILINSNIFYEFSTTLVPTYVTLDNFEDIVKQIIGAKRYCLQQFSNKDTYDKAFAKVQPYGPKEIKRFYEIAKKYVPKVIIKNIIVD